MPSRSFTRRNPSDSSASIGNVNSLRIRVMDCDRVY
jgi:hypothetical protein